MSEPLLEHIDVSYDAERGYVGLQRRIKRRRVTRAVGVAAVLALGFVMWPRASVELRTDDGSVATRLSPETELAVASDRSDAVELELKRGRGHFEVTKNPQRRYRVRSGAVTVEVLGTAFDVTKLDGDASEVQVNHGLVRVRWPDGETLLHAGEHGVYPPKLEPKQPEPVVAEPVAAEPEPPAVEPTPHPAVEPTPDPAVDGHAHRHARKHRELAPRDDGWRALARAGKHREAFGALAEQPVEDLEGLLLAADAARLSGHPREAAEHLDQLVRKYPDSAPARLAAFTLGRLQLNELADPQRAARSFARAYALDPKGPLAEDALAREAEAYRRAGDRARAAEVAARYLALFPHGSRRPEMSTFLAP
ncbi:MAG TPA: FecR domain-containing protein [Polyangiales bacterium]|nr:FecR domain-containing protein [Polyangiales bacterium]